jgi:hypothetical protein
MDCLVISGKRGISSDFFRMISPVSKRPLHLNGYAALNVALVLAPRNTWRYPHLANLGRQNKRVKFVCHLQFCTGLFDDLLPIASIQQNRLIGITPKTTVGLVNGVRRDRI